MWDTAGRRKARNLGWAESAESGLCGPRSVASALGCVVESLGGLVPELCRRIARWPVIKLASLVGQIESMSDGPPEQNDYLENRWIRRPCEDVLGDRHVVAAVAISGCCCWLMAAGCCGCCYCWLTLLLLLLLLLAAGCWLLAAGYLLHGRTY